MVGFGYDVHRLVEGIPFILGGVSIDYSKGMLAHSDGDVLTHAIIDALLGASGKGDIGVWFPDSDDKYKRYSSIKMLEFVVERLSPLKIINIDSTVVLQEPKLNSYANNMRENISNACRIESTRVNIKFKTEEFLGFTGTMEGIKAFSVSEVR